MATPFENNYDEYAAFDRNGSGDFDAKELETIAKHKSDNPNDDFDPAYDSNKDGAHGPDEQSRRKEAMTRSELYRIMGVKEEDVKQRPPGGSAPPPPVESE